MATTTTTTGIRSRPNRSYPAAVMSRLKPLARRFISASVERHLNIRTAGFWGDRSTGQGYFGDGRHYEPLDYPLLVRCLGALDLNKDDVVFEIGCGMGRVVCLLARRHIRKCVGIELSEE